MPRTLNGKMLRTRQSSRLSQQRGVSILSALLALVIMGIVTMGQIQANLTQQALDNGRIEGNLLETIKVAANNYTLENYAQLQNGLPVTIGAVTIPVGVSDGESMSPRVADLVALGYLKTGTSEVASIGNGVFRTRLSLTPVGCVPAQCQVTGHSYLDKPVRSPISPEASNVILGAMVTALGGDALFTTNAQPTLLVSMDGSTSPNPVVGNPPGIVGVKIGYGSIGWGKFLVVGDPRDPNFKGTATVMGEITSQTGVGVMPNGSACNLGEILVTGEILSRSANCLKTVWMDGENSFLGVGDAAGIKRFDVDGSNQKLTMYDAGGSAKAGFDNQVGTSTMFADQAVINSTAAIGAVCTIPNAVVWGQVGAAEPILMKCTAGVWVAVGATIAVAGTVCPVEGYPARTTAGVSLICRDGVYRPTSDLLGKIGLYALDMYGQGSVVPNPVCDPSMYPHILAMGVVSSCVVGGGVCGNNTGAFQGVISAANVVSIVGSDNSVAGTDAMLTVASFCSTTP